MVVCKCGNTQYFGDGDHTSLKPKFMIDSVRHNNMWVETHGDTGDVIGVLSKVIIRCTECDCHNYIPMDHGEDALGVIKRLTIEGYYNW